MANSKVTKRVRLRLWLQQRKKCYYCAARTSLPVRGRDPHPRTATLDHIIPRSNGGARAPTKNCVVACCACNQERGSSDARIFLLQKMGLA